MTESPIEVGVEPELSIPYLRLSLPPSHPYLNHLPIFNTARPSSHQHLSCQQPDNPTTTTALFIIESLGTFTIPAHLRSRIDVMSNR